MPLRISVTACNLCATFLADILKWCASISIRLVHVIFLCAHLTLDQSGCYLDSCPTNLNLLGDFSVFHYVWFGTRGGQWHYLPAYAVCIWQTWEITWFIDLPVCPASAKRRRRRTRLEKGLRPFHILHMRHSSRFALCNVRFQAADVLDVKQKRRIYDITNVLEGIGLIEKESKNSIRWKWVI